MLDISIKRSKDIIIVEIAGELDHHTAKSAREKLDDAISDSCINNVIVNLSRLNFMDSSGIGVFIGRYKAIIKRGGNVSVFGANSHITKIWEVSGLSNIISIYENLGQAMDKVRGCSNGNKK